MKNADWRVYRRLPGVRLRQEGCTMSDKQGAPSQAVPSTAAPSLDEWMGELAALTSQYAQARSEAEKHDANARHEKARADEWRSAMQARLNAVIDLLRQRWGNDLVKGLAELGREIIDDEWRRDEFPDADLDDVYEPANDDDDGIDLAAPPKEV